MLTGRRAFWVVALVAMSLALFGCGEGTESSESSGDPAVSLEEVTAPNGEELERVILTEDAVRRLGIRVTPVAEQGGTKIVPYAALVYDPNGATWVYIRPKPRSFQRYPVTVSSIDGEDAHLSAGPDTGTPVVTVGTPELYGAEQEIRA